MTSPPAVGLVRWSTVVPLYCLLALGYCWPLVLQFDSGLPNDTGDPGLLSYLLWWNAQAVPFTERWWNLPIYYPQPGVLTYSDSLLGLAPFAAPLIWAGVGAVATYNTLFIAAIASAAVSAHALARHLTGRHDVALLAGLAFGFSPYRGSQMPHLQLLATCWLPLALLALHRYVRDRRPIDLVWFGLAWLLNGLTSGYYLVFFAVLVAVWLLWFVRERASWIAILATLAVASAPIGVLLLEYTQVHRAMGFTRGFDEVVLFSADVTAFLTASFHNTLPHLWTLEPAAEGELYPGLAVVFLVLIAGVVAWRGAPRPTWHRVRRGLVITAMAALAIAGTSWAVGGLRIAIGDLVLLSLTRTHRIVGVALYCLIAAALLDPRIADAWRRRSAFAFYALGTLLCAVLALGPVARAFGVRFMFFAPYAWLMELPGGDSIRVPARFAMLMALCLAVAAALAFARLARARARPGLLALVGLLVLADGWVPNMQVARTPELVSLPGLEPETVVLEIPMRDLYTDTAAMLRATRHGRPLFNGFSGYGPPYYETMASGLRSGDRSVIDTLRTLGPVAVLINRADDSQGTHEAFSAGADEARLAYRTPVGPVYRFPKAAPIPSPVGHGPLTVREVHSSVNDKDAWAMTDGAVTTQWHTQGPQEPGQSLTIRLDRVSTISAIEMDLGAYPLNYPRELRIDARRPDGTYSTVWHAGTAGPAVAAIRQDRGRAPVVVTLPRGVLTDELVLSLTKGDPVFYWTVQDLRVVGRQP